MKGTHLGKPIIILFVPDQLWGKWSILSCIIYHELSHFIGATKEEVEKMFFERADENAKILWKKLKEAKIISYETVDGKAT